MHILIFQSLWRYDWNQKEDIPECPDVRLEVVRLVFEQFRRPVHFQNSNKFCTKMVDEMTSNAHIIRRADAGLSKIHGSVQNFRDTKVCTHTWNHYLKKQITQTNELYLRVSRRHSSKTRFASSNRDA
jgi:hypothetical protein